MSGTIAVWGLASTICMLLVALKTEQLDVEIETQLLTTQFFEEKEQLYCGSFEAFENRKSNPTFKFNPKGLYESEDPQL